MENFKALYKEIAQKISDNVPAIKWIDLWNSQVYKLEGEHPFPAPAVFLALRSNDMKSMGVKVQNVQIQLDVFLFYETFADTYKGSWNQDEALSFLDNIDLINKVLHGSNGNGYTNMERVSFSPVDTGGAGNLYSITYQCSSIDYSAAEVFEDGTFADLNIEPNNPTGYIIDNA